jgi:hypothetical protein
MDKVVHSQEVKSLAFHPALDCLASCSSDRKILLMKTPNLKVVYTLSAHAATINSVSWSAKGDKLLSTGEDRGVFVWSGPREDFFVEEEEEELTEEEEIVEPEPPVETVKEEKVETAGRKKEMEVMHAILKKVKEMSGVMNAMEARIREIDSRIDHIEGVHGAGGMVVNRSFRK